MKQRKSEGFTIIEVMIVLAIAGLILLIVFLAVPALQRNSRNTQRKNDAAGIAGAVSNYFSNNGGSSPAGKRTDPTDATSVDICATNACTGNFEVAKLGYYTPANVSIQAAVPGAVPTKDQVQIVTGYNCNATNTGIGTATSRSAAVLYAVETSSTTIAQQCVEQ
jgi:prepilin-type N-terminal cleavage/methylation domain-containing protein